MQCFCLALAQGRPAFDLVARPRSHTFEPVARLRAHQAILASCGLLAAAQRIAVLCPRPEAVLSRYGSDDMFYYTEVARHIAKGQGVSFDGVHPTSGVQPLWALLLVPWAPLFEGHPSLALKIDLALVTLLTLAAGCLMPRLVDALLRHEPAHRALGDAHIRALGTLAGCAWLLHPRVLGVTFEGTEGALAALCWQVSILAWSRERRESGSLRLGVALGIGTLARIDHLALAGAFLAWPGRCRRSVRRSMAILLPLGLLWGSWLMVCLHTTGSVVPDSGAAKRLAHGPYLAVLLHGSTDGAGGWAALFDPLRVTAATLRDTVSHLFRAGAHVSRFSMVAAAAMAVSLALAAKRGADENAQRTWRDAVMQVTPTTTAAFRALWPAVLAAASALLAYAVVLHHVRGWYTIPGQLVLTLVASALCFDAAAAVRGAWDLASRPRLLAFTCALWMGAIWTEELSVRPRSWQPSYVATARKLVAITPAGARIGAFNSGILGAFASEEGRRVINLDGVVNHSALLANEARTLTAYITNEGIEFLADFSGTIEVSEKMGAPGLAARLELVEAVPTEIHPGESLGIWRVRPSH